MHYLYELLKSSTDVALFEASLCVGWDCISTWNEDDIHPTEEERLAYAGTRGIVYRNCNAPVKSVDVCTFQSDTRKTVWDMLVETFNIPGFLNDAAKAAVLSVIEIGKSEQTVSQNHPISIMLNAACKSHSVVDFIRLLSPGWDISEFTDHYVEIRKPSDNGDQVLVVTTSTSKGLSTTFEMIEQAYAWEGVLCTEVQEVLALLL